MQSVAALFAQHVRRDGLRFAEADADGDNVLTFDEFLSMHGSIKHHIAKAQAACSCVEDGADHAALPWPH